MPEDHLYTAAEAASRLKVNVVTIQRWIRSGRLPAVDLGGSAGYRIREEDLEALLRLATSRIPVKVFVSHSSRDVVAVESIRSQALALGVEPYTFEHDPQPGGYVAAKLQTAIASSDAMVVLLTVNAQASQYVHQEVGYALAQGLPVIPLVERGVSHDALAMLNGTEYVAFDPGAPGEASAGLAAALDRIRTERVTLVSPSASGLRRATESQELLAVMALAVVGLLLVVALAAAFDG